HSAGDASRLAALLVGQILPVFSLLAPCDAGASPPSVPHRIYERQHEAMKILKFGGSSLSTPATIRAVGAILSAARRRDPLVVVVSAFEGVTNQLLECARLAERPDGNYEQAFERVARRHRTAVTQLISRGRVRVRSQVDA